MAPDKTPDQTSDGDPDRKGPPPPYRPHHLDSFFRALDDIESHERRGRATVLHVGDSHTASDTITGRIRQLFQDKFGSAGRGYAYPGEPWGTFRQEQMTYAMNPDWEGHLGTVDERSRPFAAGGVRVETETEGAWLERGSCGYDEASDSPPTPDACPYGRTFDRYAIFYLERKDGGTFTVSVDGGRPAVVDTSGSGTDVGVFEQGVEPGPHNIRVETNGDGPVGLFGIRTLRGREGIEYISLGINGATAGDFSSFDPRLTRREIEQLSPDMMVFAFGTNEAYNFYEMHTDTEYTLEQVTQQLADYQFRFRQLLDRYRSAAPDAACLVMLPPDIAPDREDVGCLKKERVDGEEICIPPPIRSFAGVVATQRAAAKRAGCAIWDQSHAMGGAGSIRHWAAANPQLARDDGIHLTMDGYHLLGEAFFSDVMHTYKVWQEGGQKPLETRRISTGGDAAAASRLGEY